MLEEFISTVCTRKKYYIIQKTARRKPIIFLKWLRQSRSEIRKLGGVVRFTNKLVVNVKTATVIYAVAVVVKSDSGEL